MRFTEADLKELARANPELARAMLERLTEELDTGEPAYIADLHEKQKKFVLDKSPKKTALCSRRAGKSFGDAVWLLEGARLLPHERSVYVALSRAAARRIMWTTLEKIERKYRLGLRFREIDNQLMVEHPNGHRIWLAGCKDSAELDKFRGDYYKRVVIDEAASFGVYLRELVEDVFEPALLDLQGEMAMTGTPGPIPAGPFYWATTGDSGESGWRKWSTHEWTILDNHYLPHAPAWLEQKRIDNNWDETHPTYKREWLGLWVKDPGAMVYPYGPQNLYSQLPDADSPAWRWTIGIDVGYEESSAFVVGGYRLGIPGIYIPEVFKKDKLIPSKVAAITEGLMQKYGTRRVVIDSGGLGKGYQEEMLQRYNIVAESAKKNRKRAYIEVVRGELLSGSIKVHPRGGSDLLDEWGRLVWDERREEPDDRFEDHAADAALYLIRDIHTGNRPELEPPVLSLEQREQARMDAFKQQLRRRLQKEAGSKKAQRETLRAILAGL